MKPVGRQRGRVDARSSTTNNDQSDHPEHTPRSTVIRADKPRLWHALGPGLITGASDDDPSGIATYSQAGTKFGFQLAWTLLLTYPLMAAIQAISARIGRTTGRGIAGNLRAYYPQWLLQSLVSLLFAANLLNIGADLGAMAEASRLLLPSVPAWCFVVLYGAVCTVAQFLLKHTRYVAVLKWLTLSLFSYFAALAVIGVNWRELVLGLVWPRFSGDQDFWMMVVAILGTTISPYLFFLAGSPRGGGHQGETEKAASKAQTRAGRARSEPHSARYIGGDGTVEPGGARNHGDHRRDVAPEWHREH